MKNNPLDDIVKCNVEISSPASGDASFDSILLIVPGPAKAPKGAKAITKVTAVSQADELLDYGYTTNETAYKALTVAFSQNPAPDSIYVCVRKMDDTGTTFESITDTLVRAKSEAQFYGIYLCDFRDSGDLADAISWTEANEKLFAFEYTDIENFPVKNTSFYRSFALYSGSADGYGADEQPEENKYAALAWMAKCFGYDPGTETWHLKELATVVPSVLSTSEKKSLEENNLNSFLRYGGCNVTINGKTLAGEWIDVIRFRDWIKAEMQVNVFNVLKVNRKVPFTDAGIGLIEGKMDETLKRGQDVGGIAPNSFDADGNPVYGYVVTVPKAADLTEAQRKSRKLPGCKWTARLNGAIHAVEIEGFLSF